MTSKLKFGWSLVRVSQFVSVCSGCVPADGLRVAHRCCMNIQAATWTQAVEQIYTDTLKTPCSADSQDSGPACALWVYFTGLCLCFFWGLVSPFNNWACLTLGGNAPVSNFRDMQLLLLLLGTFLLGEYSHRVSHVSSHPFLCWNPFIWSIWKSLMKFSMSVCLTDMGHTPHEGSSLRKCQRVPSSRKSAWKEPA